MQHQGTPLAWARLTFDMWLLGAETASVIALRMARLAAGGPFANEETRRMVSEKVSAAVGWQLAWSGGLGPTAAGAAARSVAHYRRKVRANQRRLRRLR